jgi:predicted nuclease of predicted toxin-antitoxin system
MKFHANENFPVPSIHLLKEVGYDVESVILQHPGIEDKIVLKWGHDEGRIILTFDKDYGELIYKQRLSPPAGLVFFRYAPIFPEEPGLHLTELLNTSGLLFENKFSVVTRKQVRQRPL